MKIFSARIVYPGLVQVESATVVRETKCFYFLDQPIHYHFSLRVGKNIRCAFSELEALQHLYKDLTEELSVFCERKISTEKSIAEVQKRMEVNKKICDIKTIEGCL